MHTEPVENTKLFKELNRITNSLATKILLNCFSLESYIQIDDYFVSPFSLVSIKRGLGEKLLKWEFSKQGWKFFFHNKVEVFFRGVLSSILRDGKVLYIKIEVSTVEYTDQAYHVLLLRYFKCLDTFYFMLTEVDGSFHFLTNPLGEAKNWPL